MKWENIIEKAGAISFDNFNAFIESNSTETYQIIDVRTSKEFSRDRIPGAISVPLEDLLVDYSKLDSARQVFIYSDEEHRSIAACQWLTSRGYKNICYLEKGIRGWKGETAHGHYELNLNLLKENSDFPNALTMAYAMEEALRQFYIKLARDCNNEKLLKIFMQLIKFEEVHKAKLLKQYDVREYDLDIDQFYEKHGKIIEGGGYLEDNHEMLLMLLKTPISLLNFGISMEAQAFDFYVRLADKSELDENRKLFLGMADEERVHLKFLTNELNRYMAEQAT